MRFRILFAVLGAAGMAIVYGFKVNLSVAIVAMVNQTALKEASNHHGHLESNHGLGNASVENTLICSQSEESSDNAKVQNKLSPSSIFLSNLYSITFYRE